MDVTEIRLEADRFYPVAEAAQIVDISPRKLREFIRDGRIPVADFGPRSRRILGADLAKITAGVAK
jgi:excisionase family DNA binding protein